jgi:hypothetical protein
MKRLAAAIRAIFLSAALLLSVLIISGEPHAAVAGTGIDINEIMASNGATLADEDGDYPDWIELYNSGGQPVQLLGWGLSDNLGVPYKWVFPDITLQPGSFLLIWASGKDRSQPGSPLHTNFAISASGEAIYLTSSSGELVNGSLAVEMLRDISYGRCTDGSHNWCFFDQPTPGAANTTPGYAEALSPPDFSQPAGFYNDPITLQISHNDPEVTIYYSLDGSEPAPGNPNTTCIYFPLLGSSLSTAPPPIPTTFSKTTSCIDLLMHTIYPYKNQYPLNPGDPFGSFLSRNNVSFPYSGDLLINDRSPEPYQLAAINAQFTHAPFLPANNFSKATIVRARAFKDGAIPSRSVTRTYFVGASSFNLPVISIVTEENNLFDYENGIYVAGKVADDWRLVYPKAIWNGLEPGNYNQRGDEWERPAHIEFFDPTGIQWLSQNIGLRIHGGWTRSYSLKALRLYARKGYDGTDTFDFPFFPGLEKNGQPGEAITSFRRLLVRNSGNDIYLTLFRDALMQRLVNHLWVDTQVTRPVIHFLNGEYWGMMNLREWYDKYYLSSHYGIDPEQIVILTNYYYIDAGFPEDRNHYLDTLSYIQQNGLSAPQHYAYLQTRIDTENYIDYNVAQIYFANTDWPGSNLNYWRKRTAQYEPAAPFGHDGRWRWILFGLDFGFGLGAPVSHNTLEFATMPGGVSWPNPDWSTFLLRSCFENQVFRNDFINRFADLLNSAFQPTRVIGIIDTMQAEIAAEIPTHILRWEQPSSYQNWLTQVNTLRSFATNRPGYMRQHIQDKFGLAGKTELTIARNIDGGLIQINRIVVDSDLPGHPSPATPYPWTGVYFEGVPLPITALPASGYQFSHWTANPEILTPEQTTDPQITIALTQNTLLTAHFTPTSPPVLIHNWHLNSLFDGALAEVAADYTLLGNALITYPGEGSGYLDVNQGDGTLLNARLEQPAGDSLRARNPSNTRALVFSLPTTGFSNIIFKYAVYRSSNGAQEQTVYYRLSNDGAWIQFGEPFLITTSYQLFSFDFSVIAGANNNPQFAVRILFGGSNASETSGNNRFDNITLEGYP